MAAQTSQQSLPVPPSCSRSIKDSVGVQGGDVPFSAQVLPSAPQIDA